MTSIFNYKKSSSTTGSSPENNADVLGYKNPRNIDQYSTQEQEEEKKGFTQRVYEQMQESEGLEKDIERNTTRSLSRMGERIVGMPGDLQSFVTSLFSSGGGGIPLPTSQDLKQFSQKSTLGYTKAQNKPEEISDELVGDVASMYTSGAGKTLFGNLGRAIGIPLVGTSVKEGLKEGGVSENASTWAKSGLMLALDLLSKRAGGSKKYIGDLFAESEAAIPNGLRVPVSQLQQDLSASKTVLQRGGSSSRTTKALQKIDEIEQRIQNGTMDPKEFPAFRKTINSAIDDLGGWDMATSPANRRQAIKHLNEVKDAIIKEAERYGQTNPQFLKAWKKANEAASVSGKSNKISNFIEKVVGKKAGTTIKTLFGFGGVTSLLSPGTALVAGAGTVAYQGFKLLYRVVNSPTLRDYYKKVISSALKENASQVSANAKALEQKTKEEDEEERKKIKKIVNK